MDRVKAWFDKVKESFGKMGKRTRTMLIGGGAGLIVFAVVLALILNNAGYEVLFSGVSADEAAQIVAKLQDSGIDYQYRENGDILVDSSVVDQTRATLVYEGYPISGFAYDTYINNAGGMSTDAQNSQYALYELQDRIGATIRFFDGVEDAKVTIALADEERFVLQSTEDGDKPTASVVVMMQNGGSPSVEQAAAIQHLVSKSVAGMTADDVAVFDGNGIEVSTISLSSAGTAQSMEETLRQMETELENKVINVLSPFYGGGNVRVSVWGELNPESTLTETTVYTTPEKIDDEDKEGIVSNEVLNSELLFNGDAEGGVPGAETNSEVTQYNGVGTTDEGTIISNAIQREYLVNEMIQQTQTDTGAIMDDITVAVSINSYGTEQIDLQQITNLVGNATGIPTELRAEKITVISAPFYGAGDETSTGPVDDSVINFVIQNPLLLAIGAAIILLIIIIIVVMVTRSKKKKARKAEEERVKAFEAAQAADIAAALDALNEADYEMRDDKSVQLRDMLREFTSDNPEISASMLKMWINGGEPADG